MKRSVYYQLVSLAEKMKERAEKLELKGYDEEAEIVLKHRDALMEDIQELAKNTYVGGQDVRVP